VLSDGFALTIKDQRFDPMTRLKLVQGLISQCTTLYLADHMKRHCSPHGVSFKKRYIKDSMKDTL